MHLDYYPGLNAIIVGGVTIAETTEFNFYIPIWIKTAPFTTAFLALIQEHSTFPTVTSVYKLYGSEEFDGHFWAEKVPAITAGYADASHFTIASIWSGTTLTSTADWEGETEIGLP